MPMTDEEYNALAETIRSGKVVYYEGRSALSIDDLNFIRNAARLAEPEPLELSRLPDFTGVERALEGMANAVLGLPEGVRAQIAPVLDRLAIVESRLQVVESALLALLPPDAPAAASGAEPAAPAKEIKAGK